MDLFLSKLTRFYVMIAKGTIEEGRRLYSLIGKENVMIKVPATDAVMRQWKS